MQYDPIKAVLGRFFNRTVFLRKIFYRLLNILLLRSWHIRKQIKIFSKQYRKSSDINVLDAGSGFGQYTWVVARKNPTWKIKGIEIKQDQVDDCNNFFSNAGFKNVIFQFDDLTTYSSPKTFDLILSVDVMEHIEEDIQVFNNFFSSIKPGGVLLISTPSDQGGSDVKHQHDSSFIEEHVRNGYGLHEIKEKLKIAGFQKVEAKYCYGAHGKISWMLSMKIPISLLGISKTFFALLPFYYLLVFPICIVLNYFDLYLNHNSGTGLIVKATKTN